MNVRSSIMPLPNRAGEGALPRALSIEAFFDWTERRDGKYELVNGTPLLQPWVKRNHNRITVNIVAALDRQIDGQSFEIATGDFAVQTGPSSIRYADVMVEKAGRSGQERMASGAIVLFEVLSDSTMHVDFGDKLREYQALSSLNTYLVVAQDRHHVWQWTRDANRIWLEAPLLIDGAAAFLTIDAIGAKLGLADIYRNVNWAG